MNSNNKIYVYFLIMIQLSGCATFKAQYAKDVVQVESPNKKIMHSFYLIGDGGNSPIGEQTDAIKDFKEELSKAESNSTALFLGDNIYPKGMPKANADGREFAEHQLNVQINTLENFKGKAIFIPGNHDWYNEGLEGLKRQEKYIEHSLGKSTFLPENGCPISKVNISDEIVLLLIDSQWYLTNWDAHPSINEDCEINTREAFFDEFESEVKKARGKTTLVAMHHPIFTNGSHGGKFSFESHMKPAPVIGTFKNLIRKTGGVVNVDTQNKRYLELKKRLITLSQENNKVVFVSGHDHNLQYIVNNNIPQIISGAGSKIMQTKNVGGGRFSYGTQGFVRLDVYNDGSSHVKFYQANSKDIVFQEEVFPEENIEITTYDSNFPSQMKASIYDSSETEKSNFYKWLWGKRYRDEYSKEILVSTVNLDTLFGGVEPLRKGGGHQSKSLRLEDKSGRQYVMRALKKNASQYIQAVAFKDNYVQDRLENTFPDKLLSDIFSGSHPYASFVVGTLADAVNVYHTNPVLYYVPKQQRLGPFNSEFGDELYMIEEHGSDGHEDKASFGYSNKVISTLDMMEKLNSDEEFEIDEASYIRARLFDMVIGDWDRHDDQWRWIRFKEDGKTFYRPLPRDRDQAFSKMSDGVLLGLATDLIPSIRLMKSYDAELKSPKWFNLEPFPLDMVLIKQSEKETWDAQVKFITEHLNERVIDEAFQFFPDEMDAVAIEAIKANLIGRLAHLQNISDLYFQQINHFSVITGTDKDDFFEIERMANGKTSVKGYRIKKGKKSTLFHDRIYSKEDTKEIWIYALDDKDNFQVSGNGDHLIKLRLVGGLNNDTFDITNGKKVVMYDYKSKPNTFTTTKGKKILTDDYETNVYNYKKFNYNSNSLIPNIGINPDDGLKLGLTNTYIVNGFVRNPFTSKHVVAGSYYFATNGFELRYNGEFARVFNNWNLLVNGVFTSPNFTQNFFGFGNETINPNYEDESNYDLNYNRVKLSALGAGLGVSYLGEQGGVFKANLSYSDIEIEETVGRYINEFYLMDGDESRTQFVGVDLNYGFRNSDNISFPTLAMAFELALGHKFNLTESDSYSYITPSIAFTVPLTVNNLLILATKLKGNLLFGNGFEFFQAASLGADDGLRGFRNNRFTGQKSFYHNTDLRLSLHNSKLGVLPFKLGIYGGLDYGRVWLDGEDSEKWHNSYGGGVFIKMVELITANVSAFNSNEGLRIAFQLGFEF
ncbi:MAG: metallophosphoesterase [Flavobacteriaceae bacterium]|nr:metallophosphoesterase [Flavobacteriaceae bacterium]